MNPVRDSRHAPLRLPQGVMLSCSLLAGKVSNERRYQQRLSVLKKADVASIASRVSPLDDRAFMNSFIELNNPRDRRRGEERNLLDSFLGVPTDDCGQPLSISSWGLGHFEHLIQKKKANEKRAVQKDKKPDPIELQQPDLQLFRESAEAKMSDLQQQVLSLEEADKNKEITRRGEEILPCGHARQIVQNLGFSSLKLSLSQRHTFMQGTFSSTRPLRKRVAQQGVYHPSGEGPNAGSKRRCAISGHRIRTGFGSSMLITGTNNKLYIINGNLGRASPFSPECSPAQRSLTSMLNESDAGNIMSPKSEAGSAIWELSPPLQERRPLPTNGVSVCDAQCLTSNSTHLFFICGSSHGLSGDGSVWSYDITNEAVSMIGSNFLHGVLIAASSTSLFVYCGELNMLTTPLASREESACGRMYELSLDTQIPDQRPTPISDTMTDVQAMTIVNDTTIYTVHGSAFGLKGPGSLCSLNVKTGVKRTLMTDGLSEAISLVVCEGRLFALCGAIVCNGNSGSLWEIDPKSKKACRVETPEECGNLRNVQAMTSLNGKMYTLHGVAFKSRYNRNFDPKGVFEYQLENIDSLQKRLHEKLCFTHEEYIFMKGVYSKAESDPLSLGQLRALSEEIQQTLRIPFPKPDLWKTVERDRARYPVFDFTALLRVVFYSITVSEVKYTKLAHEAERRRREQKAEELIAQNDWRNSYTTQQVNELQMLHSHLADSVTGQVNANAIFPKLPKHAILTKSDVEEVVREADTNGNGHLTVSELASMFREIYSKEKEHTTTPSLYFQDQHSQTQASISKTAHKLDTLLCDDEHIDAVTT